MEHFGPGPHELPETEPSPESTEAASLEAADSGQQPSDSAAAHVERGTNIAGPAAETYGAEPAGSQPEAVKEERPASIPERNPNAGEPARAEVVPQAGPEPAPDSGKTSERDGEASASHGAARPSDPAAFDRPVSRPEPPQPERQQAPASRGIEAAAAQVVSGTVHAMGDERPDPDEVDAELTTTERSTVEPVPLAGKELARPADGNHGLDVPQDTDDRGGSTHLLRRLASLEVDERPQAGDRPARSRVQYLDRNTPLFLGNEQPVREGDPGAKVTILPSQLGHFGIFGATQVGKSEEGRHITRELLLRHGTVIAFVPAKAEEWVDSAARVGLPVTLINSDPNRVPVSLPFTAPIPGFNVIKHFRRVVRIVTAFAAPGEEGANMMEKGLLEATRELLELHGYDYMTGERREGRRSPPTEMSGAEVRDRALERILKAYDHYPKSISEYVRVRIDEIIEGFGATFMGQGGHPADVSGMLTRPGLTVVDVGDIAPSPDDIGLYMSMYLNAIAEVNEVRNRARAVAAWREHRVVLPAPRDITIILEEAHNLVSENGPSSLMKNAINRMFQEFLAGGIRMGILDQSSSLMPREWLANLFLVLAYAHPQKDDQEATATLLPFAEAVREQRIVELADLPQGVAELQSRVPGWGGPQRIITPFDPPRGPVEVTYENAPLRSTRVAACGALCMSHACETNIVNRARSIASAKTRDMAEARVGTTVFFRQLLLGAPVGSPPKEFQRRYDALRDLNPQLAECVVAEVVEKVISAHTKSLETADMPRDLLATTLSTVMNEALAGRLDSGFQAGPEFIPPVLRVLIERERVDPFEGSWNGVMPKDNDPAPPLLYPIDGVRDKVLIETRQGRNIYRPVTVAERKQDLAECPASLAVPENRAIGIGLLIGDDKDGATTEDLRFLYPRDTWAQRFNNLDKLTQSAPVVHSTASLIRLAASWPSRFIQTETVEVTDPQPAGKA